MLCECYKSSPAASSCMFCVITSPTATLYKPHPLRNPPVRRIPPTPTVGLNQSFSQVPFVADIARFASFRPDVRDIVPDGRRQKVPTPHSLLLLETGGDQHDRLGIRLARTRIGRDPKVNNETVLWCENKVEKCMLGGPGLSLRL